MPFDIDSPDYTGTFLARKYSVLSHLGTGGFGSVFKAEQKDARGKTIRVVALKILTADSNDRSAIAKRFDEFWTDMRPLVDLESQAAVVGFYTHEHYDVRVNPSGEVFTATPQDSDQEQKLVERIAFVLVLEYADGGHIGARYRNEKIINAENSRYIDHLIDICGALKAAHEAGIVHRDVKLTNLLYFRRIDQLKLGDFGIATHLDTLGATGVTGVGTPPYMAPEVFEGACANRQSDIYSLGHALYELFTGERAFVVPDERIDPFKNQAAMVAAYHELHVHAPRPNAVVKVPDLLSARLSATITRMMDVKPQSRPQIDEVIETLRAERELRFPKDPTLIVRPGGRLNELPAAAVNRSDFELNPGFRQGALHETLYLIAINIRRLNVNSLQILFTLLDRYFPTTYSVCEVFGPHDFMIRVWAHRSRPFVQGFCESCIQYVLEGKRAALQLMACDEVKYLGAKQGNNPNAEINIAKVQLNNAQLEPTGANKTKRDSARRWLTRNGLYVRPRIHAGQNGRIKCYCLVSSPEQSYDILCGQYLQIIDAIERSHNDVKKTGASVYKKRFQPVPGLTADARLENMTAQFVIEYVVLRFEDAVSFRGIIVDELGDVGLTTSTLLATGRYFVDSDRVGPQ